VIIEAEGLRVEMVPSPEAIEFRFEGPGIATLETMQAMVRTAPGDERWLSHPLEVGPGRHRFPIDLGGVDAFAARLTFMHQGEFRVLRYPPVSPFPPFRIADADHETIAHGHVTPHDGFVEVFGDHHAELAFQEDRVRLFWYDVAMNQITAEGVEAVCFLGPCGGRDETILLHPTPGDGAPHYLEGQVPVACHRAIRAAFRVERGGESRTFRHRLPAPLEEWSAAAPVLDEARSDGYRVQLRRTSEESTFPLESGLELRILRETSLAPLDLRTEPEVRYRWGFGGSSRRLSPRRMAAPGRWAVSGWLPPGDVSLVGLHFGGEAGVPAGEVVTAWLVFPGAPWLRHLHRMAFACILATGLLLLLWCLRGPGRRHDLVRMLGLRRLLASRWWPALPAWITLAVVLAAMVSLLAGPREVRINPGAWLVLGLGLPAILLSALVAGRSWCALCPLPLVTDLAADLSGTGGKTPSLPGGVRAALVAAQVLAVPAIAVSGLLLRSWALASLLLAIALVATGVTLAWGRRSFCATLCALGGSLEHLEPACPLRLEADDDCPPECGQGHGRWSVLSAHCAHCGRGAADPAVVLDRPFRRETGGLAGSGAISVALLLAAGILLLSRHPLWLLLPDNRLVAPVFLYLASAGLVSLWYLEPGLRRRSGETAILLRPLLWAALAAWAFPPLLLVLDGLLGIVGETLLAGEVWIGEAPLDPALMLGLQAGILVAGAVLSAAAGWRGSRARSLARALAMAAVAAVAGLLLLVLASSFHRTLPL
jgi:hypothetical protein